MTRIATENDLVTLINVFTVAPEHQRRLLDLLVGATETGIRTLPGFVSANLHISLDGTRVANYAQWRTRQDLEAMMGNPEAARQMREASAIATAIEPHLYRVAHVAADAG